MLAHPSLRFLRGAADFVLLVEEVRSSFQRAAGNVGLLSSDPATHPFPAKPSTIQKSFGRRLWTIAALCLLSLLAQTIVFAQVTTRIGGTVSDPNGDALPSAAVKLTMEGTNETSTTATSDTGSYEFLNVRAGTYDISVTSPGFEEYKETGIVAEVGHAITVNVGMKIGAVNQQLTVTSQAPLINTQTSDVNWTIDSKRVVELPLNGRNALELMTTLPGVVDTGSQGQFGETNDNFSVNGARSGMVNFTLDGVDNVDAFWQQPNNYPNPDALQEFTAETHNFSAANGRNGGAVVEAVIRSGTNAFHGDLFEFVRNTDFDARNYFAAERTTYKRNQYGVTVGGPIKKDKAFFFFSWQNTTARGGASPLSYIVPTPADITGNYSGSSTTITDPNTGKPFPNNEIPASRISPVTQAFLAQFPLQASNGAKGLFAYSPGVKQNANEYVGRGDWMIGPKDSVMGHVYVNHAPITTNWGTPLSSSWFPTYPLTQSSYTARWNHSFDPQTLNSVQVAYIGANTGLTPAFDADWHKFGANINDSHAIAPELILSVSGYFAPDTGPATDDHDPTIEVNDTLSIVRGRHSIQTGFTLYHNRSSQVQDSLTDGYPVFSGQFTGDGFADFLLGDTGTFIQYSFLSSHLTQTLPSAFVQDDFRMNRHLTLNFGIRWDPYFGYKSTNGQLAIFEPPTASTRFPNVGAVLPGLLYPGDPGIRDTVVRPDYKNFAPRIGFAWDLTGKATTTLRAGYGIFFDPVEESINLNRFTLIPPFQTQVTLNAVNIANPWAPAPWNGVDPFPHPPVGNDASLRNVQIYPGQGATSFQPDFGTPYNQQWNASIERTITPSFLLSANYVGMKGTHLYQSIDMNPALYIPGQSSLSNINQRRRYNYIGRIEQERTDSYSNANMLQIGIQKRYSHGYTLLSNYTYGHQLGLAGPSTSQGAGGNGPRDPNNWRLNYGSLSTDIRHTWQTSLVWDVPGVRNMTSLRGELLGGWEVSGIILVHSGLPFTPTALLDASLTGIGGETADLVGNPSLPGGRSKGAKVAEWFNTSAFAEPAFGTFGTSGIGILRGPGYANVDLGIYKNFQVTESQRVQFRFEAFNVFNRANFNNPGSTVSTPSFGVITSAGDPRVIELALKYFF
jgi:Carboxypeptidase regulatory-like domain